MPQAKLILVLPAKNATSKIYFGTTSDKYHERENIQFAEAN